MSNIRTRIEHHFKIFADYTVRNKIKVLFFTLLVFCLFAYHLPKIQVDTTTEGMLHPDDPAMLAYNDFRDQFGRDEFIVVAIESDRIFSQPFLQKLKTIHEDLEQSVPYLDEVTSLINARNTRGEADRLIVEDLMADWPQTEAEMAALKQRVFSNPLYENTLISDDGRLVTLLITTQVYADSNEQASVLAGFDAGEDQNASASEAPPRYITNEQNSEVVLAVEEVIARHQSADYQIYLAGSPVITHKMFAMLMPDAQTFLNLALLLIVIFLFLMFRRLSGVLLPVLVVLFTLLSTVGLMAWVGIPIKLPTQILPSFLIAICVGDAIHILAVFYKKYDETGEKETAISYAIGHSGLAVALTSLTTAGGLISFVSADIAPIAELGVFASIGVLFGFFYTVCLIPSLLALFPVKAKQPKISSQGAKSRVMDRFLGSIASFSTTYPKGILVVTFFILVGSGYMATKIDFSHLILKWLPENDPARLSTEKLDKDLKGSFSLNMVIDTGKKNGLYDPAVLNRLEEAADHLEQMAYEDVYVGKAWSLSTVLKEIHQALNENQKAYYSIPQDPQLIAQELLLFEMSGSDDLEDFVDSQFSKAHLVAKVPFVDAVKYSHFLKDVRAYLEKTFPEAEIKVTGLIALMLQTVNNAITSMAKSYIIALCVITILMIFLVGGLRVGLLSMIPNLFPIIFALGMMSLMNVPMDMFSLMFASIVIGLAVDDTIHFLHNFRRYYEQTGDAVYAVHETLQTAGRAMLVTTIVLSAGFLVYTLSSMNNLFYFGVLTSAAIMVALLADFFIAPALMMLVTNSKAQNPTDGVFGREEPSIGHPSAIQPAD